MLSFFNENFATIIGSLLVLGILVFAVRHQITKRHKGGCGCSCAGCPSAGMCHPK